MRTALAAVGLLALGACLMANPLYLPVSVGAADPAYTHTVRPATAESPVGPESAVDPSAVADGAVVAYADLDSAARAAFDRAREAADGGFGVEDPDERVDSLSYPVEPTPGDGLLLVEYEGERYEFWTRTVEREPGAVVFQRALLQPVAFLVGFLAVVAGVALGGRDRLSGD